MAMNWLLGNRLRPYICYMQGGNWLTNVGVLLHAKWGLDSEFMQSGEQMSQRTCINTISDGTPENTYFIDSADQLKSTNSHHTSLTLRLRRLARFGSVGAGYPKRRPNQHTGLLNLRKDPLWRLPARMWDPDRSC